MRFTEKCIHCGKCTKVCDFLTKYDIDLSGFEDREDLKYHCFLCNKCTAVCPVGINGSELSLLMRRKETEGKNIREKGYGMLILEKHNYKFRSWSEGKYEKVVFPGCNYTSLYPKTLDLIASAAEKTAMGIANDCCGKPLYELGLSCKAEDQLRTIETEMEKHGAEEIVTLCPNCYHYFKKTRLKDKYRISMIYEALPLLEKEGNLKIDREVGKDLGKLPLFRPCPDTLGNEILDMIRDMFKNLDTEIIEDIQCCGLGGCAAKKDPELVKGFSERMKNHDRVLTYCATCTGQFRKGGMENIDHILSLITGTHERADVRGSLKNRMTRRF